MSVVELTYHSHACFGIEVDGTQLLIDPFLTGNALADVTADEVQADYILVSHGHGDHIGDSVDIAKRTNAQVICNFEVSTWFQKQGIEAHAQHIGGGFNHPFGYLKLTQALHGSMLPDGSDGGNPAGFLLTTPGDKKIYLACDTGLFGDMSLIGEEGIDLAVIPIGDNFTMGPTDAVEAVKLLSPKVVIPMHYSTFDVVEQDPAAFKEKVEAETKAKCVVLDPGQSIEIS